MDLQSHFRNRGDTDNTIHRDRRKSRKGSMVMADRYRISMKEMNKSESERLNREIYYERHKIFFFFFVRRKSRSYTVVPGQDDKVKPIRINLIELDFFKGVVRLCASAWRRHLRSRRVENGRKSVT